MNQVIKHHESFVADFPDYDTIEKIVVSNLAVSDQQGQKWAKKLKTDRLDILSTESSEANERLFNPNYFAYIAFAEFNYYFYAFIAEGENSGDYVAAWESEYVWILFKWFQINKVNTGIS